MSALFNEFWDILWNAFFHAVSLEWSLLIQDGYQLIDWWHRFWDVVEVKLHDLWDGIENLGDYVSDLLNQVYLFIHGAWSDLSTLLGPELAKLSQELRDNIFALVDLVDGLPSMAYYWILDLTQWILGLAWELITPYVDAALVWIDDAFSWVLDVRNLITVWLAGVKDAITWLAEEGWSKLVNFLADPFAFVLGELLTSILDMINWWLEWVEPLNDFLTLDLPALRDLLAEGLSFLQTLVSNPSQTVLDLLYPVFLDWVEQLIVDNW